jgi:hypothetical protein
MASNTTNGKAFEYACLRAIQEKLQASGKAVVVNESPAYLTTVAKFNSLSDEEQDKYMDAARSAVKLILPLEPRLENGADELYLAINADAAAQGVDGDVRDVLCLRTANNANAWEIGLSCKHDHEALKHPRITQNMDFGENWVGIPNSSEFIDEISSTIDTLIQYTNEGRLWRDIAPSDNEKWNSYYVPILTAYKNEIIRMCDANPDVPKKLLSYFFGSRDFYKVIMKERQKTTTIEAFNMHGTLGQKAGTIRPLIRVPVINMPTRLIEADFKKDRSGNASKTTLVLVFDGGWTISMRLHNKDEKVKLTGLAWDIQLVGLPTGIYMNTHPWYEEA